jgi:hypothetical protein
MIAESGRSDTAEDQYRHLKPYIANDTKFFKRLDTTLKEVEEQKWMEYPGGSCVHLPRSQNLGSDEAYRFIYRESFCYYRMNITVSRKKGDRAMHHADLWGLQAYNGDMGLDGDDLEVYGYNNHWDHHLPKFSYAYRWRVSGGSTLYDSYLLVLKLSGAKSGWSSLVFSGENTI